MNRNICNKKSRWGGGWDGHFFYSARVSSLVVPGVPWHPQILADQLTLSQPGGPSNYYWHPRIFRPSDGSEVCSGVMKRRVLTECTIAHG